MHVLLGLVGYLSDNYILTHLYCVIQSKIIIFDLIFLISSPTMNTGVKKNAIYRRNSPVADGIFSIIIYSFSQE